MPSSRLAHGAFETIRRRGLLGDGDRVAVALSGGPDSVALTWVLRELEAHAPWRLTGLIHVHHGLRGADADADEVFCRALASRLDLPIHVTRADVPALARTGRLSVEAAARRARYAAFDVAAEALRATTVATAHTLDDQAETVLLRLLRGAGGRGLSAIRPRRGSYIRPFIDCRRAAIVQYLNERGEPFRDDASNRDLSIPRNRIRHSIVRLIDDEWPGGVAALARAADLARDDEDCLMNLALAAGSIEVEQEGVRLDPGTLATQPPAIGRRLIRMAIEAAGGIPRFLDVEAVRRLARADKRAGMLHLPHLSVERREGALWFARSGPSEGRVPAPFAPVPLGLPGEVRLSETGPTIRASFDQRADLAQASVRLGHTAVVQADTLLRPLSVRYRRPGDRLRPLGAPGSRKLQDWFVDRKVPRASRDRVPLVVDAQDRIVWVAGFTIAHEYRVTAPAGGVVVLELDKGNQ